ncbi:hypothetical protein GV829_04200 [Sphingomonas lacunae]|uniref:Uncharacterized protein n=1 Tax=Sphingomonas lacunae TaxID=2698828 RepID=A0A6M4ATT4_9SPHN|nr:hypothetical protein [Sphingomonas lacunae]QJQ31742.1 hypothetical protein GV829_04200 [Sphingomonas lacunae]
MEWISMLAGALVGLVPIILIIRASDATLLRWWIACLLATLFVFGWMLATLPRMCRTGECFALQPWAPLVAGGLLVATLIGAIRWLASRGKRPW